MNFNKESRRTMYEDLSEVIAQSKMYSNLTEVDHTVVNIFIPVFKKLIEDCEELELNVEQLKLAHKIDVDTIKFLLTSMEKNSKALEDIIEKLNRSRNS